MICDSQAWSDDDSSITTKNPLACEPQTQRNKMILELSSLSSLLQNCLPPAANQNLAVAAGQFWSTGRCSLVLREMRASRSTHGLARCRLRNRLDSDDNSKIILFL